MNTVEQGVFSKPQITIASWNVNGLNSCVRKGKLQAFIQEMHPDVLCLNETKLTAATQRELSNKNVITKSQYPFQYFNNCQSKAGYSGTALFSTIQPLNVKYGIGLQKHDSEGRTITAEFTHFYVVATYIPNAGQMLKRLQYRTKEWDVDFRNYLYDLLETGKYVIWLGDLNVIAEPIDIHSMNVKLAGCTPEERASFKETLNAFVDSFRFLYPNKVEYSWWNEKNQSLKLQNKGWRLDYAVISYNLIPFLMNSEILKQYEGSDHCPIQIEIANPCFYTQEEIQKAYQLNQKQLQNEDDKSASTDEYQYQWQETFSDYSYDKEKKMSKQISKNQRQEIFSLNLEANQVDYLAQSQERMMKDIQQYMKRQEDQQTSVQQFSQIQAQDYIFQKELNLNVYENQAQSVYPGNQINTNQNLVDKGAEDDINFKLSYYKF